MELEEIDDCINKIYKNANGINITVFQNLEECKARTYYMYPSPLISYMPYEYGEKIYFDLVNKGGWDLCEDFGYLIITVYVNEFTIRTNHTKFWKCTNCEG